MKCSDAILAGSSLVKAMGGSSCEDQPGTGCAMTMAGLAMGIEREPSGDFDYMTIWEQTPDKWPWLRMGGDFSCPDCRLYFGSPFWQIVHIFDHHVMAGEWTLEQLVDYVRTIEPPETPDQDQGDEQPEWSDSDTAREMYASIGVPK